MERLLTFDIAKKIGKPAASAAGLMLRSAEGDSGKVSLNISTGGKDGNDRVRAAAGDYRLRSENAVEYVIRGKSVEVSVGGDNAPAAALDLMADLNFINEDVNELTAFWKGFSGSSFAGQAFEAVGLEADEGAFRIKLCLVCDDGTPDEEVYAAIMPALSEYNMGIVKVNI